MKIVTPGQMNIIDSTTINRVGIPGIVLMENAALQVVEEIGRIFGTIKGKRIFLFAGKGNNAGDAFAVARHLSNKGARLKVYILAEKSAVTGDALINLKALENCGIPVFELLDTTQLDDLQKSLASSDLVVDGILGTGLSGDVLGLVRGVIHIINSSGKYILSIDIPSGICGKTGQVRGACIKAEKTVTFGLPKTGMVIHPGCQYTGELVVADISIPTRVISEIDIRTELIDDDYVARIIPHRYSDSSKGTYGKVLIVSGSVGMTGAGCLVASASLRTGAGLVYMGVPSILTSIYDSVLTESITIPLEDGGTGYLAAGCTDQLARHLGRMTVAAVGPGLSVEGDVTHVVRYIIEYSTIPLVLDADALNAISQDVGMLENLQAQAVITPHPGEMARLMGMGIKEIQEDRIGAACGFSQKWGVITVLKGARNIVAAPDGTVLINPSGNSGMATGGTGDVLTGVIASLIAQGASPFDAAAAGVYLHGLAGDNVARIKGEHGLVASDIVKELPYVLKKWEEVKGAK